MSKRLTFTPSFKAQVVLEVLTGAKGPAQVCQEYGIRYSMLSRWKETFLERAPGVFDQGKADDESEKRICELERMVGRLTMELEIAKKTSLLLTSRRDGNGSWQQC